MEDKGELFIKAIKENNLEYIQFLSNCKDDIIYENNEALILASKYGHTEIAKLFIDKGGNINGKNDKAVEWAEENGYTDIIQFINNQDNVSTILASKNGHIKTLQLLIDNGADITARDNFAIKYAAVNGHVEIVILLLKNGVISTEEIINYVEENIKDNNEKIIEILKDAMKNPENYQETMIKSATKLY